MGIYKMTMTKNDLFDVAAQGTRASRKNYHSDAAADVFKDFSHIEAAQLRASYAANNYGKYTLAATVFAATSLYLGALFFAPALIPFGLAAIATTWLKYTVAAVMLTAALYSGAMFLTRTANEFKALVSRFNENELTNSDVALLATTAVAGFGVVGMMYAFPAMLPLLGTLGTLTKAATATAISAVSATAGYAAFFGRPKPTTGGAASSMKMGKGHGDEDTAESKHNPIIDRSGMGMGGSK
jgi:hypothetical protein